MPASPRDLDRARLAETRLHPRVVELWFALQALRSVTGFMQSGAHPDDETSAMLAALRFRDGLSTSYVCSTRGEGGQNDIGAETVFDLGTIRTAEMERAAERLDMRMWWFAESPDDPVYDFGFSKSGPETLGIWGHEKALARFVEIVRLEKPDILVPTFLDVGGQHGHHRAMTQLAHEVFAAAADPGFASNLPPWEVSKLYLPGWGGGGGSYDDDVPPPDATVTIPGTGRDPMTGWSFELLAQHSRMFHRTQGMGHWIAAGRERDWPLHLAETRVGSDQGRVTDNLALTLTDLGLDAAQGAIDAARAAFPDFTAVAAHAAAALSMLDDDTKAPPGDAHRLARKRRELVRVLRLASGLELRARTDRAHLLPGESTGLTVEVAAGEAEAVEYAAALPRDWSAEAAPEGMVLTVGADARPSDPYPAFYDPLDPALPALSVAATIAGQRIETVLPFEVTPLVGPGTAATLQPDGALLNLARPAPLEITVAGRRPEGAAAALELPDGWGQSQSGSLLTVTPPDGASEGLIEAPLSLDGVPAMTERLFDYPHIAPRLRAFPAVLRLRAAHVALPGVRVGYTGTGNDRVMHWLRAMGLEVVELTDSRLDSDAPFEGLGAVVVGVFGFRRPALDAALPKLHDWVRGGGSLVTLYHRPGDNWKPEATPLARLVIGSPSLRWRVTDQTAEVTMLAPEHAVFAGPNAIGPADWSGWKKERGLYFAKEWDAGYTPLTEMADPGEAPHRGALLVGDFGKGRHAHVALGLHHQLNELVPGAFRLMANLVAPR